MITTKQDRGLADVLVTPRLAAWLVASPLRESSMPGEDVLALGLLGGSARSVVARTVPAADELPFILPEAAKRAAGDDEDEDADEDEDDLDDEDDEDEDEDDDLDEDDDDDDDDEDDDDDDDEDEDDEDFLDDDDDDDYDDEEEEFAGDEE